MEKGNSHENRHENSRPGSHQSGCIINHDFAVRNLRLSADTVF